MHKVLKRQLQRLGLSEEQPPQSSEEWQQLLQVIQKSYVLAEEDRYLLERSLEISSKEMKERMEKNKEMNLQLVQASKLASLGTLASGVAHELNNPLQMITGFAELILAECKPDQASADYASRIMSLVDRSAGITKHLLKLARDEKAEDLSQIDPAETIDETLKLLEKQLLYDNISIEIDLKFDGAIAKANSNQLSSVILNLVTNSRDAFISLSDSSIVRNISIKGRYNNEKKQIEIVFKDNAGGMPPEVLNRIFDPFFTTKSVNSGTGLGLPLSRRVIEDFGGQLTASVEGANSEFKILLPAQRQTHKEEKVTTIGQGNVDPQTVRLDKPRMLIVDDESMICDMLTKWLSSSFEVTFTTRPNEALEFFKHKQFEIILTDVLMPGISGDELARKVRENHPETKLILMSGHMQNDVDEQFKELHPFLFVSKPFKSIKSFSEQVKNYYEDSA